MALLFSGLSLVIYAVLCLKVPSEAVFRDGPLIVTVYRGAVCALGALSVVMLVTTSEHAFHSAISMHLAISLLLLVLFEQPEGNVPILMVAGLLPLSVYESFPLNLWLCGVYGALILGVCILSGSFPLVFLLQLALVAATVSLTGSLMGSYWEKVVALQAYVTRLEDNVAALARANSLSQDYARDIEEESRVAERLSLTRDIHDAIGYTLTNTIMAMEAVKMMVKSEPGRVGEYLEVTRGNTEEGLALIKRILREFRSKERTVDPCFIAVKKLVKVFTLSTGLAVRYEFGNVDLAELDRFGECVYHFIQEGLINAFRHGRARHVTLLFWDYGDSLRVTMDDDGSGCAAVLVPGIGLTGMVERAKPFGGHVTVEKASGGFRISIYLVKSGAGFTRDARAHDKED